MTNQWDQYADLYDTGIGDTGDSLHQKLIEPLIRSYTGDVSSKTVIDVGCGNGYLSGVLRAKSYVGIDASLKLIQKAKIRSNKITGVTFVRNDITKPIPSHVHPSDFVIANMVLQYVGNIDAVAKNVDALLVDGGFFIAVIDHPAHALFTRAQELAGMHNDKFIDNPSYFNEGYRRKKSLWSKAELSYYHRTIAGYVNTFTNLLHLDRIDELTEDGEMPRILGMKFSKR